MRKGLIITIISLLVLVALVFSGIYYYQATHFNRLVAIDNIKVGGLSAEKAINKLKTAVSKNIVYVGDKQIYDGKDTALGFTDKDLPEVKHLLKKQRTFLPSQVEKDYTLIPSAPDQYKSQTMLKEVKNKLLAMNKSLKAPKDAEARLVNGKIVVSDSVDGTQYDVKSLLNAYRSEAYHSVLHLDPIYLQPNKDNSPRVQKEKEKLQAFANRTVDYVLQGKTYAFKGSEIFGNASLSKDMKIAYKGDGIKKKLEQLNQNLSTLNKNYTFKTHSGSVISVKGESYGWAINVDAEAKRIKEAFEKGEKSILAYNIYGEGWNINGVGYHNPAKNGIGDTYVEVSIQDQRIWVYKDGQLKVTTNVVTGRHNTHEDTPKGVWYIEYKASPSVLKGSEVGNPNYSVKVNYWAPFTLGGAGFHDAGWRSNWSSNAYLTQGSGGCVNTPPSVMKTVYDNLTQYEPVVIY